MIVREFIPTETLCIHYNIEISFIDALTNVGLIEIIIIEQNRCIHQDQIGNLEKIIRLHNELNLTIEAIDIVFNLLEKEQELQNEIIGLKNRLRRYENE